MNKSKLNIQPSMYYLSLFNDEDIRILPYMGAGDYKIVNGKFIKASADDPPSILYHFHEQNEQGAVTIGKGDLEFAIYFPLENSKVPNKYINIAKSVLSQIVEMDNLARAVPSEEDFDENLAYINISEDEVELHYFAGTVNTEWGAYFVKEPDGTWEFKGLG